MGHPFIIMNFFTAGDCAGIIDTILLELGDNIISARTHTTPEAYATNREYFKMTLKEYCNQLFNDEKKLPYAANNNLSFDILKKIKVGLPLDEPGNQFEIPKLWMGPKSSSTPLHRDSSDNFAYHLYGKKKWTIFSIADTDYLYFED
jgi:hypothetical protein